MFASFSYGDILATMWFSSPLQTNKKYRFIIVCHGLPSHPYQHAPAKLEKLLDAGFVLLYPQYRGTQNSKGTFTWEGCIETVASSAEFLRSGKGRGLYNKDSGKTEMQWSVKDITVLGLSFGGSVALVAGAKSYLIDNIISVAGPIDYRTHNRLKDVPEDSMECIYSFIDIALRSLWRTVTREEYQRIIDGSADVNPVDYVSELKNKKVLLVHGEKDVAVGISRSKELYAHIKGGKGKKKFIVVKNTGHELCLPSPSIVPKIVSFLHG